MVTIYTTETCIPCKSLKRFFDHKGVEYRVFDADQEPHLSQLWALTGTRNVPVTVITGYAPIFGLNYPKLTQVLKEAGIIK